MQLHERQKKGNDVASWSPASGSNKNRLGLCTIIAKASEFGYATAVIAVCVHVLGLLTRCRVLYNMPPLGQARNAAATRP